MSYQSKWKLLIKARLKEIISTQDFVDFVSDEGTFGKSISGEYKKGSTEWAINEEQVNVFLDGMVDKLLRGI